MQKKQKPKRRDDGRTTKNKPPKRSATKKARRKKFNNYAVEMARIGYGHATIVVRSTSPKEAERDALNVAGNYTYPESSSDYEPQGVTLTDSEPD